MTRRTAVGLLTAILLTLPCVSSVAGPGEDMDYGPFLACSVTFVKPANGNAPTWDGVVTRALVVQASDETTVCYDMNRLALAAVWSGGFLDRSKTHHTSYKGGLPPRPGGPVQYRDLTGTANWLVNAQPVEETRRIFRGLYLHGASVVLSYQAGDRAILETVTSPQPLVVRRSFQVGPGKDKIAIPIANGATSRSNGTLATESKGSVDRVRVVSAVPVPTRIIDTALYLDVSPGQEAQTCDVFLFPGNTAGAEKISTLPAQASSALTADDPGRWSETFTTTITLGDESKAYAFDEFGVPVDPYGAWMRPSGIACFEDGRVALSTLSGDVWIASWNEDDREHVRWRRFAAGLYEPLGLKVVDGKILVRGRDQITRLHDRNEDGEADFYEHFHSGGPIGPGYHAFLFDLARDRQGNLYFATSGRKSPTKGEIIKVSPDGKSRIVVGRHFRHPNGLGAGGPDDWITIADNPDGKFPSGASVVPPDGSGRFGYNGPRNVPMLYVLPPKVDTSAGSQCWTDPTRFGPLGNCLIHTSFSTSTISYVLVQKTAGHPNGFAVHVPYAFKAGAMRACVNPRDGQMYIAGQRGWDTNAAVDASLTRMRYTGKPAYLVDRAEAVEGGVKLHFSCALDEASIDYNNFYAERVGKGIEEYDIDDVTREGDATVLVEIPDLDPHAVIDEQATKKYGTTQYRVLDPLCIEFNVKARDGTIVKDKVYCTINDL